LPAASVSFAEITTGDLIQSRYLSTACGRFHHAAVIFISILDWPSTGGTVVFPQNKSKEKACPRFILTPMAKTHSIFLMPQFDLQYLIAN
jgi:hypothetical protein